MLLLASVASRSRVVCVGWSLSSRGRYLNVYRNDVSIPDRDSASRWEELISPQWFEEFLRSGSSLLLSSPYQDSIRLASWNIAPVLSRDFERNFLGAFSSLEALAFSHCRQVDAEFVLPERQVQELKAELKDVARTWMKDKGVDSESRAALYESMGGLNRTTTRSSIGKYCADLEVPHDDLWPVVDSSGGIALVDIRNRLAHGYHVDWLSLGGALVAALSHLEWLLQRAVLRALRWPLENSTVQVGAMSRFWDYQHWTGEREVLSAAWPR